MRGEGKSGNKPIEDVEGMRARVAKLERLRSKSTEHTNSDGQLDEAWHEWEKIFDVTKDSIMLINSEFKIIQANRATSHFLCMPLDEIVGRTCWQVVHGTEAPTEECPLKKAISSKKHEQVELHIPEKDVWIEVTSDPILDDQGNVDRVVHIIRDITERKKAEISLRKERDKAQKYLDVADVMLVAVDSEERVGLINKKGCEILGYKEEEILGKNWFNNFLPERIRNEVREILRKLVHGESDTRTCRENPVLTKNGEERLIDWHNTMLRDEKGTFLATLSSGQDITERKKTKEQIVKLARFPAENPNPILRISSDGTIIYANNASSSLLNAWKCGVGQFLPERWKKIALDALSTSQNQDIEVECEDRTFSLTFAPFMDYSYINAYGLDITERKRGEQTLADEAIRRRILIDQSRDGVVILDENGKVYEANQRFIEMLGYTPEETSELHVWDWDTRWTREQLLEVVRSADATGDHFETYHRRKDGSIINVEVSANAALCAGQKLIFCVHRDITKRKEAKKALQESEEKYRSVIENANIGIIVIQNGQRIFNNSRIHDMLGYTDKEYRDMDFMSIIHPEDREYVRVRIKQRLTGELTDPESIEIRVLSKSGEVKWIETNSSLIQWGGKPALQAFVIDITERKKAAMALRDSRNMLQTVLDSIPSTVFWKDRDSIYLGANRTLLEAAGLKSSEEIVGKSDYDLPWKREQAGSFREDDRKVMESGIPEYDVIEPYIRADGTRAWAKTNKVPLQNAEGNIVGVLGTSEDITERKRAEEKLYESEKKYRSLIESLQEGVWVIDADANTTYVNRPMADMLGYTTDEMIGKHLFTFMDEQGIEVCKIDLADRKKGIKETHEFEFIRKDGERLFALLDTAPLTDEKGHYQGAIAGVIDITERKKAEKKIQDSEIRFRSLIEQTTDAVFCYEYNPHIPINLPIEEQVKKLYDCVLVECNDVCAKSYGKTKSEEVVGKRLTELFGISSGSLDDLFRTLIKGNYHIVDGLGTEVLKDGSKRYYLNNGHGVIENGMLLRVWGTFRDITEPKKAEESLRKSEEHYRMLAESMNDGLTHIDENGIKVYVNKKCADMFGYSTDEMLGKRWSDFYDEDAQKIIEEQLAKRKKGIAEPYEVIGTRKDGSKMFLRISPQPLFDEKGKYKGSISILTDISERKRIEREKQLSRTVLEISSKHRQNGPLFKDIIVEIQKYSGCEAVGLRVLDEEGNIPYEAYVGFNKKFYESESPLSIKLDRCMCINVIKGDTNPELPFYTDGGSFYMNGTTRFLATVSEQDKGSTRNVCNEFGYESVALIPIFLENRIYGLIHLADTRENMVPLDLVQILERITKQLGSAIQRVLAEEALIESEERYRDLFNHMSSGVAVYEAIDNGKDFIFKNFNQSGERIENVKKEQLLGKSVTEAFPGVKKFGLFDVFKRVWKTGKAEHYPVTFYQDERIKGWRDNYVYKLPGGEIVAVYDDVTERKKAEDQLIEDQVKLKAMASKILMTEERERRRLAIGLHDDVCQKLVFAKLAMESSLKSISDTEVLTSLKNACENIGDTIHEAESLTFELSNPILREFGFVTALERYLNDEILQEHGIEYEFEKGKRIGALQDEIKTCLFRVARELLTNVVKHAHAKKVKVSIRGSRGQLNVSIQDNGVGFDTGSIDEVADTRFGLFSVREQLEYFGGRLEIESVPGQGTNITVIVPLRKKSNNLNSRGK